MAGPTGPRKSRYNVKVSSLGWLDEWWWPWPPWGNKKGTQFVGEDPESILDLMHYSDTQSRGQGSSGKYWLEMGEDGPKETWASRVTPARCRESRRAATGTWLNQLAHPLCRAITKELGEIDRRKGEVSLFILCSVRFKFLTMRRHSYVCYIII